MRRAAVFPVASSVGVARSPRVGVPTFTCVASGGWWVWAGVIRTASASCFGGACWGCASPGVVQRSLGVGRCWSLRRGMPFLGVGRGACRGALFLCASVPAPVPSWSMGGFLAPRCVSSGALSLWAPAPPCPLARVSLAAPCPPLARALPLPGVVVVGWGGGAPMAQAWGWVAWSHWRRAWGVWGGRRPWTASRRRASHAACGMRSPGRPRLGWRGCGCAPPRRCAPCAPLLAFPLPRPTSPSGGAPAKRGQTTRRGGRGPGGGRGLSSRSWSGGGRMWTCGGGGCGGVWGSGSGGGGGWGWSTGTGGEGNGRGRWTWGGGGGIVVEGAGGGG